MPVKCLLAEVHSYNMYRYILLLIAILTISNPMYADAASPITDLNQDSTNVQSDSLSTYLQSIKDSLKLDDYENLTAKKHIRIREKSEWCDYNIYLPKGFNRYKEYNLVIGMHGYLDTADSFGKLWKFLKNKDIIFIVPESPFSLLESTQAVIKWGPFENNKDVYSDPVYQKGEDAVIGILKGARQLFKIKQTWMLGFSQGASFTYLIAFHYPELFDGIAPLSGWFVQTGMTQAEFDKCKHIKVLISHGVNDPIVSHKQSHEAVDVLTKAGFKVKNISYKGAHTVNRKAVKAMVRWINS